MFYISSFFALIICLVHKDDIKISDFGMSRFSGGSGIGDVQVTAQTVGPIRWYVQKGIT